MRLNLYAVKYAFFDFDDTLCVWTDHIEDRERWFEYMFRQDPNYFLSRGCCTLPGMKELLSALNSAGVECYGLSWIEYSYIAEAKTRWAHSAYGKDAIKYVIGTSSREGKIEFLKDFCIMRGVSHKEILFVDDNPLTVVEALGEGFQVMSAVEITIV